MKQFMLLLKLIVVVYKCYVCSKSILMMLKIAIGDLYEICMKQKKEDDDDEDEICALLSMKAIVFGSKICAKTVIVICWLLGRNK